MPDDTRQHWTVLVLTILTVTLGGQCLRYFLPLIVYTFGTLPSEPGYIAQGVFAIVSFLVGGALAGPIWGLLKPRRALILTAGGVGLARLAAQFTPSTITDLPLMTAATILFLSYLAVVLGNSRRHNREGGAGVAVGIILGLALDTALHGAWRTYDLVWQSDPGSTLVVVALVAAQLYALYRALPETDPQPGPEAGTGASVAFLALGPFLLLQLLVFQNVARLTVFVEGVGLPQSEASALALIVAANALSVAAVSWIGAQGEPPWERDLPILLAMALLLVVSASLTPENPQGVTPILGVLNALAVIAGGVVAAVMLTLVLMHLAEGTRGPGLWRTTIGNALGALLFIVPTFAYYIAYDVRLPYSNNVVPPIAAAVLALAAIPPALKIPHPPSRRQADWRPAQAAMGLIVVPLILALLTPTPAPVQGEGGPLRIVDYNLHMGFDVHGQLGMEALAAVVDENDADVVVLQEVSRGWTINGSHDMLAWLSYRLDMPYIFAPAADPIWGNAILSRYPITEVELGMLPRGPVAMKRGYVRVTVDYGAPEPVHIIGTHLHHLEGDTDVRIPQVDTVLNAWGGDERTLIMGDMNAHPGEADVMRYLEAGLLDVYSETGSEDSLTYISYDPYELIDWIFASPDVTFLDFEIPRTTASDHLPLVTTVELP